MLPKFWPALEKQRQPKFSKCETLKCQVANPVGMLEFSSGLGIMIIYALFLNLKEEGLISALGEIGHLVWVVVKMYIAIATLLILIFLYFILTLVVTKELLPNLSSGYKIGAPIILGMVTWVKVMEYIEKKRK